MFQNVDNLCLYTLIAWGVVKMLLFCSTLVTKRSKMCRLLAAIIFINITMGMGWGC